ncbi:hypothetical protein AAVH_14391 [Aphelenchoides avenae]|nr:hypothetical protein AAVH_14391 [Aphelenchus avenae]
MRRSSARLRTGDRLPDWHSDYERIKADRTIHIKQAEIRGRIQRILGSKGASGSASREILHDDTQIVSIICPRKSHSYFLDIVRSAGATVREVEISADGSNRCLEPEEPTEAIEVDDAESVVSEDADERDRAVVVPLSTLQDMRRMTQKILLAKAEGLPDAGTEDASADLLGSLAELHGAIKKCIGESKPAADSQRAEQLDQKVQEMEAKLKDAFHPFEAMKKMPAGFGIIGIPKKQRAPNDSATDGEQQETDGGHDDGAEQQEQQDDLSVRLKELEGHPVLMFLPPPTVAPSDLRSENHIRFKDGAESSPAASQPLVAVDAVDELEEGIVLRPGIFFVPLHTMDAAGNFEPLAMKHFGSKPSGLRLYPAISASTTADKIHLLVCPVDVGSIFGNGAMDFAQILRLKCTVQYEITNTDRWTVDHMLGLSDLLDEYCGLKPGIAVFGPQHVRYPRMIVNYPDDEYAKVMQSTDDSHENKLLKLLLQAGRQSTDQLNASS